MAKMGRPKTEIDWELLRKITSLPILQSDAAWIMDMSVDTLARAIRANFKCTFAEYMDKSRARYRLKLHQKQYEVAMNGNPTMLIWLGKQHLGQRDVVETQDGGMAKDIAPLIVDMTGANLPKDS